MRPQLSYRPDRWCCLPLLCLPVRASLCSAVRRPPLLADDDEGRADDGRHSARAPPDGVVACAGAVSAAKQASSCSGLAAPACAACVERQRRPSDGAGGKPPARTLARASSERRCTKAYATPAACAAPCHAAPSSARHVTDTLPRRALPRMCRPSRRGKSWWPRHSWHRSPGAVVCLSGATRASPAGPRIYCSQRGIHGA